MKTKWARKKRVKEFFSASCTSNQAFIFLFSSGLVAPRYASKPKSIEILKGKKLYFSLTKKPNGTVAWRSRKKGNWDRLSSNIRVSTRSKKREKKGRIKGGGGRPIFSFATKEIEKIEAKKCFQVYRKKRAIQKTITALSCNGNFGASCSSLQIPFLLLHKNPFERVPKSFFIMSNSSRIVPKSVSDF